MSLFACSHGGPALCGRLLEPARLGRVLSRMRERAAGENYVDRRNPALGR